MSVKHLYLIAVAAILGCAPASSTPGAAAPRRANLLTAEEIRAANADVTNVYDAISRLRPIWLSSRGQTSFGTESTGYATVFVDGQPYGELLSLRNIPAYHVADIRYYDSAEAGGTFGIKGGSSGVIEVRTHLKVSPPRT